MPFLNLIVMSALLFFVVRGVVQDKELSWRYCVLWILGALAAQWGGFFLLGPSGLGLPEAAAAVFAVLLYLGTLGFILWHQGYGWRNVGIVLGVFLGVQLVLTGLRIIAAS